MDFKLGEQIITVSNMKKIAYCIITSDNIFHPDNRLLYEYCKNKQLIVFISETIQKLYGRKITYYFSKLFQKTAYHIVTVQTSEQNKNINNILRMCSIAKKYKLDRKGIMIGIGGGIVNDLVGFCASIYKRSVPYIRINTTLVGQIDVALGIKTGVNFESSKNFLGSFYPPLVAINDRTFLCTLDEREIRCGLAEIIKMAIIRDKNLFELVEANYKKILREKFSELTPELDLIIHHSMFRMVEELSPNLYERDLERLVDFGHSFSPHVEIASNHRIAHGEAVAIDIAISSTLAFLLGMFSERDLQRILHLFLNIGLPIYDPQTCQTEELMQSLEETYLHRGRKLNLVVPMEIGKAIFLKEKQEVQYSLIDNAVDYLKNIVINQQVVRM